MANSASGSGEAGPKVGDNHQAAIPTLMSRTDNRELEFRSWERRAGRFSGDNVFCSITFSCGYYCSLLSGSWRTTHRPICQDNPHASYMSKDKRHGSSWVHTQQTQEDVSGFRRKHVNATREHSAFCARGRRYMRDRLERYFRRRTEELHPLPAHPLLRAQTGGAISKSSSFIISCNSPLTRLTPLPPLSTSSLQATPRERHRDHHHSSSGARASCPRPRSTSPSHRPDETVSAPQTWRRGCSPLSS